MTSGGASRIFLDTNVLVYATVSNSGFYQIAQNSLKTYEQSGAEFWISRQILREYLATLSRPQILGNSLTLATLVSQVQAFETRFQIAEDNQQVMQHLLTLLQSIVPGGRQIYDTNIVATMQVYGITQLLTNNVADFTRYSQIITVLPLQPSTP